MLRYSSLPSFVKSVSYSRNPVVVRVTGDIDEDTVEKFEKQVSAAHTTGQPVIPVVINSNGGEVYALLSIMSIMESSKLPIATIVPGFAGSAACALFACGTPGYRYMARNARLMMHDVSQMMYGSMTLKEMCIEKQEMNHLNKQVFEAMSSHCKKSPKYFSNMVNKKGGDLYMSSADAKKHGLACVIGLPSLTVKVSACMNFGLEAEKKSNARVCSRGAIDEEEEEEDEEDSSENGSSAEEESEEEEEEAPRKRRRRTAN